MVTVRVYGNGSLHREYLEVTDTTKSGLARIRRIQSAFAKLKTLHTHVEWVMRVGEDKRNAIRVLTAPTKSISAGCFPVTTGNVRGKTSARELRLT